MPVKRRGFERLSKVAKGLEPATRNKVRVAMQESLEEGRDELRRLIDERGTGRTWYGDWGSMPHGTPGRTASKPGRNASGNMRELASFEISADTKNRVRGRFGWLGRLGSNSYVIAQDQGFRHWITGEQIQGMRAVRDAAIHADQEFERRAEKIAIDLANFRY